MNAAILLAIVSYLIASIPFSVVVGYLVTGQDIRNIGDGNPGATNVKRATGSTFWFVIAMLLDGFKGLFPVGIPYWFFGWNGMEIVPVAIAALLGHAYSLYLGFKGGKAIAITGGVWTGLLILEGTTVIALMLVYWYMSVKEDEWAVVLMMLSLLLYLLLTRTGDATLLLIWLANMMIVIVKHRRGLTKLPTIKRWLPLLAKDVA